MRPTKMIIIWIITVILALLCAAAQQAANQESLCDQCACTNIKAICDYQLNKTLSADFDSKYYVPRWIKSIEIYLSRNGEFHLFENFLQDYNQVNYFAVKGVRYNDKVELTRNSFSRNKGGYPNIVISNVSQAFIQEGTFSGKQEFKLLIEDIDFLVGFPNAFMMAYLDCTLRRIGNLQLKEKAIGHGGTHNGINLRVEDSNIDVLSGLYQSMSKVSYSRCNISTIAAFAFDVTNIRQLSFVDCNIKTIKSQAFTGKLHSENVSFVSTVIGTIEGEAINQSGITTLTLQGNTIQKIQSGALQATAVGTYIFNNTVHHMEPKWLIIVQASQVEIENNHFGHFSSFEVNGAPKGTLNCSFANNQLDDPQQGSLNLSHCVLHRISVGRICSCDDTTWLKSVTDHDLDSEILCRIKSADHSCFNVTTVDRRRFVHEACGGNETRHCFSGLWVTQSESDKLSGTDSLWSIKQMPVYLVGLIVIISFIGVIVGCFLRRKAGGQTMTQKCMFSEDAKVQLSLEADKLSGNDCTRKGIKKMIKDGPFTEEECLTRVCEIIENISDKSSPIKDLLSNHLTECHESGTPMSASGGDGGDYGDYVMSPIGTGMNHPQMAVPSAPSAPSASNSAHIYEELNQQRPLIRSDYSELPPPAENQYSVPFNAINANDMPPAYQYATPMRHPRPQPPSTTSTTSACYASPVWRSTPSAIPTSRPPSGAEAMPAPRHVRDLRQDLEAMPQFHPNQLTSARNQRQLQQNYPQPQIQSQPHPPPYSQPGIRRHRSRQSFECLDGAASLAAMEHMDSGSDHSGGSDVTVQITDVIDYADA